MHAGFLRSYRPLDYGIFFIAVTVVAATAVFVYAGSVENLYVTISANNQLWQFPLETTETLAVSGPLGTTKIAIKDGLARIVDSPCENKTCIIQGAVHKPGQFVACLPNAVIVTVEGSNKQDAETTDAMSW